MADVYDVSPPTLDGVADAIVARTHLTGGVYEQAAVMDLVAFMVEDADMLNAFEKGGKVPHDVLERMAELIANDPPATVPEWDFLQIVLDNVRAFVFKPPSDSRIG